MSRSSLPVDAPARIRLLVRALLTAFVAALLAAAGLVAASPAAAKTAPANLWVSAVSCSTGDDGTALLEYEGMVEGFPTLTVTGEGYSVGGTISGHGEIPLEGLAPGLYSINMSFFDEAPAVWGQFTIETCPPDVDVAVTPLGCSTGDDGAALLTLTGLVPGEGYTYSVTGPTFEVGGMLDEVGETEEIELVGMPPGNYVAYAEQVVLQPEADAAVPAAPNFDWVGFSIEPCQPETVVSATECMASGGTGAAVFTLSNLVAGIEYGVRVTDRGVADGTPYGAVTTVTAEADGTATVEASGLPAGHEYSVWVEGVWVAEPWEEPPYVGNGGNFTPLETVVLAASADFTLAPCPAAPAPATVKPAALAESGADAVGDLFAASILLLGLGGAVLFATRLRRTDAPS